jgi:DNA-directed RNA polymerase III subunit RPC11
MRKGCPYDLTHLVVGNKNGLNRLECPDCPYIFEINVPIFWRTECEKKVKEDEVGPVDYSNASQTNVQCPREGCKGDKAAYFQVQIRSADEPMTTFYKVRNNPKLRSRHHVSIY